MIGVMEIMEITEYKQKKQNEMKSLLFDLIDNWEDEVVEFKEASRDYDKDKMSNGALGEAISADYFRRFCLSDCAA